MHALYTYRINNTNRTNNTTNSTLYIHIHTLYTYRNNNANRTDNSIYIINYVWGKIVKIYICIYYIVKKIYIYEEVNRNFIETNLIMIRVSEFIL